MLDILKELCALRGVSGDEGEVRDYIIGRVREHADKVETDVLGNVIVYKKGARASKKKILLCAHMDEVGVIITSISNDGYLRFDIAGSVDSRVVAGKAVTIGKQGVFGVIGCKPAQLYKAKERERTLEVENLYIDIGAKNRDEAARLVSLGDTGAFEAVTREFGDGFIKARAIDDRFGCAVLVKLIESDLPIDCTFAFTVQEEVGLRGAYTVAHRVAPEIALIIEGTTAADFPSVADSKKVCRVGGGAVIPFMDGGTIYDKEIYGTLTSLAESNKVPWQTKNVIAGGTDAAAIQRSRAGVKTAGIAAPVRNLHSQSCVAKVSDLDAVLKLARLFLDQIGENN